MTADGLHPLAAATQTYLDAHFCDASVLAESAGIPETTLEGLVAAGMVPQPAYVVAGDTLVSAAFGPLDGNGLRPGQYHRKAAAPWAVRAAAFGGDAARAFELELRAELAAALRTAHSDIFPLDDAFDEQGRAIQDGLDKRLDSMVRAYRKGVFSICIADLPSSEGIVRKEVLQEKLTHLTGGGSRLPPNLPPRTLATEIDAYADAAMPFTPREYPVTSRKRLVEDLKALLA